MPVYDVSERHHTVVRAPPWTAFGAIKSLDLSDSLVVRALLFVRAVPALAVALVRSPRGMFAEARVRCAADVRARFRLYWLLIRPGSSLIRRIMLRAIRRMAEA